MIVWAGLQTAFKTGPPSALQEDWWGSSQFRAYLTANCLLFPWASTAIDDLLTQPPIDTTQDSSTMATTAQIPPGGTYLDTFKVSFIDVPVDAANGNAVSTPEFLEASRSLTSMFGSLPRPLTTRCWRDRPR